METPMVQSRQALGKSVPGRKKTRAKSESWNQKVISRSKETAEELSRDQAEKSGIWGEGAEEEEETNIFSIFFCLSHIRHFFLSSELSWQRSILPNTNLV